MVVAVAVAVVLVVVVVVMVGLEEWRCRSFAFCVKKKIEKERILLIILCMFQEKDGWVGEVGGRS